MMNLLQFERPAESSTISNSHCAEDDRYVEFWDGVRVVSPMPNDEHQEIVNNFCTYFTIAIAMPGLGKVRPGVNVSDRVDEWALNFREPDVVVYLKGTKAANHGTHWVGGPDFAIEVVSHGDRSREKLDFYAAINTREVLLVDRFPWALELYRLENDRLKLVDRSTLAVPTILLSEVLPFGFRLIEGEDRPMIEVTHRDGVQCWIV